MTNQFKRETYFTCMGVASGLLLGIAIMLACGGCSSYSRATTDGIVNMLARPASAAATLKGLQQAAKKSPDTARKAAEALVADVTTALQNPIVASVLAGKIDIPQVSAMLDPSELDSIKKVLAGITDGAQEYLDSLAATPGGKVNDTYRSTYDSAGEWCSVQPGLYAGYVSNSGYVQRQDTTPSSVRSSKPALPMATKLYHNSCIYNPDVHQTKTDAVVQTGL